MLSLQGYGASAYSCITNLHTVNRCLDQLEEMKIHDSSVWNCLCLHVTSNHILKLPSTDLPFIGCQATSQGSLISISFYSLQFCHGSMMSAFISHGQPWSIPNITTTASKQVKGKRGKFVQMKNNWVVELSTKISNKEDFVWTHINKTSAANSWARSSHK